MPGTPPPPTQIFKTPKIRPGDPNFKLKSTTSMGPTIQAAQPTQWDLAAPGVTPMKTNVAHDLGSHTALDTLGLTKEAASPLSSMQALTRGFAGFNRGWGGKGLAGRQGLGGLAGGAHNLQEYYKGIMSTHPGAAAGAIGLGAAGATGAGILGAHAMFSGNGQNNNG